MGRLWQTLILSQWQPVFIDIPVESLIYQHQESWYQALRASTAKSDSAPFIEFMLGIIARTLQEVNPPATTVLTPSQQKTRVETRVEMKIKTPQQILTLLAQTPTLTLGEVAQILEKSPSTIERAVAQLKQQQKLSYIGPKKGGFWQVL
ncbi:Fic family protein [Klebsiella sp. BIGb0407]|nr:Fic family protein [Klebsiella sp. BIGb0407]